MAQKKKRRIVEKPYMRKRIVKNVKQGAALANPADSAVLENLCSTIASARNYMFSRLSGVQSILLIQNHRKLIRDKWMKDVSLIRQFRLPARHWKMVLDEVVGNVKSMWSNTCNRIKMAARNNDHLTDDEKQYIYYVCSVLGLFGQILQHQPFERPKGIEKVGIRERYVHNLIRRYARRYKGNISRSSSKTFQLDTDMYSYDVVEGNVFIEVMTHIPKKRLRLRCFDGNTYKKNIRVTMEGEKITLHHPLRIKANERPLISNEIGLDKGYRDLLVSSSGNHYGEKLNSYLSVETERLNEVNQKRNPYYAMVRELEATERKTDEQIARDKAKAERIRQNNIGKLKYNRHKNKHDATMKAFLNQELNRFFRLENPSVVAIEQLKFVSWDDRMPKHVRRKLSRWIKGYLDDRLSYKCDTFGVDYIYVNPAYTSQECHVCGCLGERKSQTKFCCHSCGVFQADENAAKVIAKRMHDSEISIYTPYKKVREILEERKELLVAN